MIDTIAFDAHDTLCEDEIYFVHAQVRVVGMTYHGGNGRFGQSFFEFEPAACLIGR